MPTTPAITLHRVILRHPPPSGRELPLNSPDLDAFSLFHQLRDTTSAWQKHQVWTQLRDLKSWLESHGSIVRMIYLPPGPHGEKVGLDDWIAARVAEELSDDEIRTRLFALASDKLRDAPRAGDADDGNHVGPYCEKDGGFYFIKQSSDGPIYFRLADFTARIVSEVACDEGAEQLREFEVEVTVNDRMTRATIPATQFAAMNWTTERCGAGAIIAAGMGARDRVREAIQLFSRPVPTRILYAHTGWRPINGAWCFLHAGGAIGSDGPVANIETALPDALAPLALPDPPTGEELTLIRN